MEPKAFVGDGNTFLDGDFYQTYLEQLHSMLRPKTYFEIGTLDGDMLKLSSCASISVDPKYQVSSNVIGKKPTCHFFQMTSDNFFAQYNPQSIFGQKIDLAFLGAAQLFELLLRDFINTELHCSRNSVIVLHACIPMDELAAAGRQSDPLRQDSFRPGYWTGDVWKIVPALKQWRPDLTITVADGTPKPLILITAPDPNNTTLSDNYQSIVDEYLNLDLDTYGLERLHREFNIVSTNGIRHFRGLRAVCRDQVRQAADPPEQLIPALQAELAAVYASTSWRITAPFRAIKIVQRAFMSTFTLISKAFMRADQNLQQSPPVAAQTAQGDVEPNESPIRFTYVSPLRFEALGNLKHPSIEVATEGGHILRMLSRPGPSFHDDPDGAYLFARLEETRVPHSPPFIIYASRLRQVGYRSYLSEDGRFFNDEAPVNAAESERFLARISQQQAFMNEETGLVPTGQSGVFTLDIGGRRVERLDGEVVSLCSFEPTNYGAFLFRVLPKIAGRQDILKNRKLLAPIYNEAMSDLFAMAGVPTEQIIQHNTHAIYMYDKAIIPSLRNTHCLLDDESLAFYADLRQRYGTRNGARKLFVSRLGWTESYAATHRIMLNEEQLAQRLVSAGFELIRTHTMSARQQVEAFSSADLIVGASGSAMFNVVFSHPGTKLIDIESEPHWIINHTNLFGSCGLDYGIFEAKAQDQDWSVHHKPFTVNVEALMARIANLEKS
jgi:hypothetical protein